MNWTVTFLDDRVEAELEAQPDDIRASFERIVLLVTTVGLERLPGKYARHLRGKLWELRMTGRDGIARAPLRRVAGGLSWCAYSRRNPRRHRRVRSNWRSSARRTSNDQKIQGRED